MKESDLYIPVRDWLLARGHIVHVEIFDADIVTECDGKLWAIELKPGWTRELWAQLYRRTEWADHVVAATARELRGRHDIRYYGYGWLHVDAGKVRQRIKPRPQPWHFHQRRAYRLKRLSRRPPAQDHEMAGLPSCPALREQREMRKVFSGR